MRPLFTIHAGEFLVGEYIEKNFRGVNVWVPCKDTGVDLLVTNFNNQRAISFQVKFSRDFLDYRKETLQGLLTACGWWKISRKHISQSKANYWIFVLLGFAHHSTDFIVIEPFELLRRMNNIHGNAETIQSYFWVTKNKRCWEARGLKLAEQVEVANGTYAHSDRDFTEYLNRWEPIHSISSGTSI